MCHLWFNLVQEQNCSSSLSNQINQNFDNIINKTGTKSINESIMYTNDNISTVIYSVFCVNK